jgi:hypothetical protein
VCNVKTGATYECVASQAMISRISPAGAYREMPGSRSQSAKSRLPRLVPFAPNFHKEP